MIRKSYLGLATGAGAGAGAGAGSASSGSLSSCCSDGLLAAGREVFDEAPAEADEADPKSSFSSDESSTASTEVFTTFDPVETDAPREPDETALLRDPLADDGPSG